MKKEIFFHRFIKSKQSLKYPLQKEQVGSKSSDFSIALLQIDFAKNYVCVAQVEVQSFHWVKPHVSLFKVPTWYNG